MEQIKKNWWIVAIVLILIYLWYSSEQSKKKSEETTCKKMDNDEWEKTLDAYQGNFVPANMYIKAQGYCPRTSD